MYKANNKELILIYNIYLKQNICEKKSFHLWLEEQYDLIKNLQKRREKAAAKKVKGGMLEPNQNDTNIRKQLRHIGLNIKYIINLKDPKVNENHQTAVNAFSRRDKVWTKKTDSTLSVNCLNLLEQ